MARFNRGEIVYWVECHGVPRYEVNFGMVDEEYADKVCIDMLEIKERRRINGIPFNDFRDENFHKLPKGWTYNTKLFELTYDPMPEGFENVTMNDPDSIKFAYENGWLVKAETINPGYPETKITKDGYRIEISYGTRFEMYDNHRIKSSVEKHKVYRNYNDAFNEMKALIKEYERQAALSEEEWAKEQIEKSLTQYKFSHGVSDEIVDKCREFLFRIPDIAEVITRVTTRGLEWKYEEKKKWMTVVV